MIDVAAMHGVRLLFVEACVCVWCVCGGVSLCVCVRVHGHSTK